MYDPAATTYFFPMINLGSKFFKHTFMSMFDGLFMITLKKDEVDISFGGPFEEDINWIPNQSIKEQGQLFFYEWIIPTQSVIYADQVISNTS